jgi:hypothetical protein
MSYQVVVTKIDRVTETGPRRWEKMYDHPAPGVEQYGYAPPIEETRRVEVEVLKQTVEALDLAAVIRAINNL